ncbi:amino acid ABC transporter ATP-binding protein [Gluconacetobacter takamatsuzukensis]|uniref:Amino acid ABC transporter ATP-binding protein n=1 Tax=Gluconacetobacter takamatsuzukensis TaxID=1286190 RepID=A0A7W4KEG4_9PROT|nr:amino acid ABC transporter ATP-binding protein [Gluconacetobacter takamatsuzukensis]MBB2205400.1 amino acid ABC transporter ATP-binding protein [Gluconacetobacter takamatsuzukensis]
MIEIRNVRKSFGETTILDGISLDVHQGELLCLIGGSGSGKSTLLQCINGLEPIQGGEIHVDGVDIRSKSVSINHLRRKIGMVFQQYEAFPHLTALENVALAPRVVARVPRRQALEDAHRHLAHVGLGDKAASYPRNLSGGQQQRLAIARALAMEPRYMLFDEVTSALDPELVAEVLDTMRTLKREGMTMVVVTHDMDFVRESADRVAFLSKGTICEIGSVQQVMLDPQTDIVRKFLSRRSSS